MAKSGPKLEEGVIEVKQRTLTLDDLTLQMFAALGGGEDARGAISRGARRAARMAYAQFQSQPDDASQLK